MRKEDREEGERETMREKEGKESMREREDRTHSPSMRRPLWTPPLLFGSQ
jgi:hypothetical protein